MEDKRVFLVNIRQFDPDDGFDFEDIETVFMCCPRMAQLVFCGNFRFMENDNRQWVPEWRFCPYCGATIEWQVVGEYGK